MASCRPVEEQNDVACKCSELKVGCQIRSLFCVITKKKNGNIHINAINPLPYPGIVVGAVHGRRGTRAAARGAPGAAW